MLNQNSLCSPEKLAFCGRVLSQAELDQVRQILTDFPFRTPSVSYCNCGVAMES